MNVAALCFASVVLSLTHVVACGVQPTNLCPLYEFLHGKTRQEEREGAISRKMAECTLGSAVKELLCLLAKGLVALVAELYVSMHQELV